MSKPAPLCLPIQIMLLPLNKRFKYHFYGNRQTNSVSKVRVQRSLKTALTTETFGSNMSKSGRWLTQEGTKCLMCAVMQCCRSPGSQGCCSVSLRWDRISCHDQCYREVMFLWLYIEILVVDKRTYELLKEPLFDFWMINRSKPSSEPWRARGQHLTKSTDGGAVHTFHYF